MQSKRDKIAPDKDCNNNKDSHAKSPPKRRATNLVGANSEAAYRAGLVSIGW